MCYSPSPPPSSKSTFSPNLTFGSKCSSDYINVYDTTSYHCRRYKSNYIFSYKEQEDNMQRTEDIKNVNDIKTDEETASDYKQWLHAMKLVARLPGGIPPEFRRKLWLSLADKYLKSKNVDWANEQEKCFREKWREDDEELGIQIVKDLHRTGSTLCTGPAGDLNQAKLKRILLGYARYNPKVGYCQGFNMLGALILQVMDKDESESIKVMIYLVEGILPAGYFCGSMGGLQADMAVFRELMQTKLPRLAKHLQKLQGPIENAFEPPLTNVFTMQWFLTMFCTCLPMSCVLRVWDLVLIEGSDVLLRTALALWSLLEERVLSARSADDFYGKMGSFSSELLNGHLIDSNGLIEKVVQLGPISDIKKLRDKHLCNIAPIERQQGLQLYFDDDEPDMDESSRLAIATVWGIPWGRRGSQGQQNNNVAKQTIENKDRIALDISLLKKQYDKLRERQKQAQIILTTACSSASRQSATTTALPVNQLLAGRTAIVINKGRRCGPPTGAIPPARKPSLPAVLHDKPLEKQLRRGETLLWRDTVDTKTRRDSLSWKEIKAERAALISSGSIDGLKSQKLRTGRLGKSDSSSYSEESDDNDNVNKIGEAHSSTDTSLEDEDLKPISDKKKRFLNSESNDKSSSKTLYRTKKFSLKQRNHNVVEKNSGEKARPKSWAPSNSEIPFVLMTADSPTHSSDENPNSNISVDQLEFSKWKNGIYSNIPDEKVTTTKLEPTTFDKFEIATPLTQNNGKDDNIEIFDISNEGVTNEYFERVNSTERPTKLDLFYSLNDDESIRNVFKIEDEEFPKSKEEPQFIANGNSLNKNSNIRCMDLLVDYSEKSSAACIEEAKTEISAFKNENILRKTKTSAEKRRDPRRLTLTRSSTMDIEKRFAAFEKRFSMELCTNYARFLDEIEVSSESKRRTQQSSALDTHDANYTDIYHETLSTENILPVRKIPSTADLEVRFENIQQQLVRDRNRSNKSPCDSECPEKQANSKTSPAKSMSSSSQKGKITKQPNKYDGSEKGDKIEGEEVVNKKPNTEEQFSESIDSENEKKSSSTRDSLSDIVVASTSKALKSKPMQKKKEPPDGDSEESNVESESLYGNDVSETEGNINKIRKKSKELEKEEAEKSLQTNSETVDGTNEENLKESTKTSDRTSPPTTEELEKRFSALEEKLNSDKNESKGAPNEISQKSPKKSTQNSEIVEARSKADTGILNKNREDYSQTLVDPETSLTKSNLMTEKTTQRRLSEPPSTEDLERRYDVLKRRMSSRNFETKTLHKESFSVQITNTSKNKDSIRSTKEDTSIISSSKKSPPSIENLEERFEKLQTKNDTKVVEKAQSSPSTENLEERFEKLQNKIDAKDATTPQSPSTSKKQDKQIESENIDSPKSSQGPSNLVSHNEKGSQKPNKTADKTQSDNNTSLDNSSTISNPEKSHNESAASKDNFMSDISLKDQKNVEEISGKRKTIEVLSKNANKIKIKLIEELQAKIKEHSIDANIDTSLEKKMAVIEELKTKMKPLPDKFLKPTQISSRRRPPSQSTLLQSLSFNDETLESHATSAIRRSEKHAHASSPNRKLVRRFSDLPSRADLENRLQFLEDQLSKTVRMQRRASDSEVASKHFKKKATSSTIQSSDNLEYRVKELEKRLKDNRTISMDVECTNAKEQIDPDIGISQVELVGNSVASTGKELVRYSSHGEVGENERQNPINISINIQMTLNKQDVEMKKISEDPKSDDLDKRLQILEQRFKTSVVHDVFKTAADNFMKSSKEVDANENMGDTACADEKEKCQAVEYELSENTTNCNENISDNHSNVDQSSPVNMNIENADNQNLTEIHFSKRAGNIENCPKKEFRESEIDQVSDEVEIIHEVIEENKIIESTELEETEIQKTSLKECKEEKGVKDDKPETKTKEIEKVEQIITDDKPINTDIPENNSKYDKNIINSLQQKPQTQSDVVSDLQETQLKEDVKSQENIIELENCVPDDSKMYKDDETSDTKTYSKIENLIDLNKGSQFVPVEVNKKTLVLLLDNEPKAVKVRRLTRANTEELEDLFQALEKQLNDRGQQKNLKIDSEKKIQNEIETSNAMSDLTKEIEELSNSESNKAEQKDKLTQTKQMKQEEEFDWGTNPIKFHLKKRTVHLPSTKELEARFRSLERQIKLLEDVEKINVEHRLTEIERKIKLQYSLSHEKDLNKFLELCEGKDPDEILGLESCQDRRECCDDHKQNCRNPSPNQSKEHSSYVEQHYRTPNLKRSKSKQSLKKQPIHPLEMLLDPSPDERDIPSTGELEHRIRVMKDNRCTPSPPSRKSRSQSPPMKEVQAKHTNHKLEQMTASPTEREIPTAEELEARLEALERKKSFDFKMQKDFQQFNQKLKDVVSPSPSFDEFKTSTTTSGPIQTKGQDSSASKQTKNFRTTSPKTIRFHEADTSQKKQYVEDKDFQQTLTVREGLGVMGNRLMRETSPLRRKGTHTGIPLRTGENINDQLTSIQNTIKSIDSLCEEKPYRKEKCQQYIDSLFSDSTYFAQKKSSLEDLASRNLSRSTSREIGPSIRISDHSPVFSRSMGSADSIRSASPLRSTSPLQYRSNRDLRREPSPRRRREEDREEHESRLKPPEWKFA